MSNRPVGVGKQNIRRLLESDLPEILEIERQSYSFPWSEAVFRDCFKANYRLWAVESPSMLEGYAVVAYMADEAHLLNLCVSRKQRRSGIGRSLLRHLIGEAAREGMCQVLLEVRASNDSAAALYLDEGFVEIGRRPNYYPDGHSREDARVLTHRLVESPPGQG